jgi:hypothetical protein
LLAFETESGAEVWWYGRKDVWYVEAERFSGLSPGIEVV